MTQPRRPWRSRNFEQERRERERALLSAVEDMGGLPEKPDGDFPSLSEDMADLSDQALSKLMVVMTQWTDYLDVEVVRADIRERVAEDILEQAKAETFLKSGSNTVKARAERTVDQVVRECQEAFEIARARRKLTEGIFRRAERASFQLSRELTRRTEIEPRQRRGRRLS